MFYFCTLSYAKQFDDNKWDIYERAFLSSDICINSRHINCHATEIFYPYGDFKYVDLEEKYKSLKNNFASGFIDPWIYGGECITRLRYAEITGSEADAKYALQVLRNLHAIFLKNGRSFPHPAYGNFPDGWVSSMDTPTVALCAQIAYQMFLENDYRNMRDDFIEVINRETKDGGFYLLLPNNLAWFSEYSNRATTPDNEMYVLNGFLISLQSVLMLAQSMNNDHLMGLYTQNFNSYRSLLRKFWYKDNNWSYYMLNPREPIPPHYMIFETKQLNALQKLISKRNIRKRATETSRSIG